MLIMLLAEHEKETRERERQREGVGRRQHCVGCRQAGDACEALHVSRTGFACPQLSVIGYNKTD